MSVNRRNQPNVLRGLLIAPVLPALASYVGLLFVWPSGSVENALAVLLAALLFGIPISFLATFLLGAPFVIVLQRFGALTPVRALLVGLIGGFVLLFVVVLPPGEWHGLAPALWCLGLGVLGGIGFTFGAWGA